MADTVTFTTDNEQPASGFLAVPQGDSMAPAVVLLQEWWGHNAHLRALVDRLADAGFIALAPDLYQGRIAKDADEAQRLMTELKWPEALHAIAGARSLLAAHPRSNGKVGVIGFCMGGAGAFVAAGNLRGFSAAVPFYGTPPDAAVEWSTFDVPVQGHFSSRDRWATVARATELRARITAAGGRMDLHVYDAEHAFVNDTRPEVYSPANAKLAWERAMLFLHQQLG